MPYWEMLGRAVITLDSEKESEQITRILTYSGLDATIAFDPETNQYTVTVPLAQEEAAKRLLESYHKQEERAAAIAAGSASASPTRAREEDKLRNANDSSLGCLIGGAIVFIGALLQCILVMAQHREESSGSCVIQLILGSIFLIYGLYNRSKVMEIRAHIEAENQFTTRVIEWCLSTYPAAQLDQTIAAATEGAPLRVEEWYFLRRDLLRCYIIREFDISDTDYLEYLTDEIYISIFEKQKLGQKADDIVPSRKPHHRRQNA